MRGGSGRAGGARTASRWAELSPAACGGCPAASRGGRKMRGWVWCSRARGLKAAGAEGLAASGNSSTTTNTTTKRLAQRTQNVYVCSNSSVRLAGTTTRSWPCVQHKEERGTGCLLSDPRWLASQPAQRATTNGHLLPRQSPAGHNVNNLLMGPAVQVAHLKHRP